MGCGKLREESYFQKKSGYKMQWEWYARAGEIVQVVDMLLPWLGERRKARALEIREIAAARDTARVKD